MPKFKPGQSGNPNSPRKLVPASKLPLITEMAARGCREQDICRAVGMTDPTWRRCKADFPEVAKALADGQQRMHDQLVTNLMRQGKKQPLPNIYLLNNRFAYEQAVVAGPQIVINLPSAQPLEAYKSIAIEHAPPTPEALTAPKAAKGVRRG